MGNRGFRRALFSEQLGVCGAACGLHSKETTVFTLVYAKGTLKIGQKPKILVTVTDRISDELMAKMNAMGIDTKMIKLQADGGKVS